ncbi:MAG: Hsp20/alpha crystallin family protein [Candidatus Hodarchaeales archaeon]|jgi:HSP20 family protein
MRNRYNNCGPAFMPRIFFKDFSGTEQDDTRIPKSYYDYDEDKDILNLTVELPGVSKDDVKINTTDRTVSVSTITEEEESKVPKFGRKFRFHYKIKPENVSAKFENGVLELNIERDLPQKFDINID